MTSSRDPSPARPADSRRAANVRLALILASIALAFFVGYVLKIALVGPK